MGFGAQPSAAPAYNAPNLAPLLDFHLANLPSDAFAKLPSVTTIPKCHYLPLLGDRALFSPINNITSTVRLLQLLDYSQYALAAEPADCGGSMPTTPISGRYIYMPQGFSASGVRGSAFYRYDPWTDAWTTLAAITTLAAAYRFNWDSGCLWDGGDYIYVIGGYDGTDIALFRYSISGDSWAELADAPATVNGGGGCAGPIGDYLYALRGGSTTTFYRYSISGDSWATMAAAPAAHSADTSLVQDPDNTDLLYSIGQSGAVAKIARYSISADAWTELTGTNQPLAAWAKGIFFTKPVPMILVPATNVAQLWVYKI